MWELWWLDLKRISGFSNDLIQDVLPKCYLRVETVPIQDCILQSIIFTLTRKLVELLCGQIGTRIIFRHLESSEFRVRCESRAGGFVRRFRDFHDLVVLLLYHAVSYFDTSVIFLSGTSTKSRLIGGSAVAEPTAAGCGEGLGRDGGGDVLGLGADSQGGAGGVGNEDVSADGVGAGFDGVTVHLHEAAIVGCAEGGEVLAGGDGEGVDAVLVAASSGELTANGHDAVSRSCVGGNPEIDLFHETALARPLIIRTINLTMSHLALRVVRIIPTTGKIDSLSFLQSQGFNHLARLAARHHILSNLRAYVPVVLTVIDVGSDEVVRIVQHVVEVFLY